MRLKNLCRLCGLKEDTLKDLKDENNKSILNIVRDFIQIEVTDSDDLPTKICLNCEHTIVSFQLFVLECYRVQDILRKNDLRSSEDNGIIIEISETNENNLESSGSGDVKLENISVDYAVSDIKTEVKDEFSAEDIVIAIGNQDLSGFDDSVCNEYLSDGDCEEDDVAIATLKKLKKEDFTVAPEVNTNKLDELYMIPTEQLKLTDFFKFTCHVCGESSNTLKELSTHCLLAHKRNPYVTCICGQVIKSKHLIHNHYKWHQRESKKFLKECNESEITNETRRKYLKNLSDYVKFTCQTCLKEFSSWYKLKSHCESAHKLKTVVRCKCGAILKSKSMLYKHTQDHNNPSAICCDKCPRVLKTEAALAKHKLRHIPKSERKFTCGTCNKIFHTKDCLKSHQKSHIPIEERKIYHCDVCNLKFTTRSSATSHKRVVHEKIKSYVCDLCGYACGTNGELRQHRAIHSDDKPHTCTKCSKSFKTYSNLKTHMDTHEDTSYECYVCSRVLNSRRTLRKHLLVHEDKARHVCSYCNKAFKRRQTLKVHMYTHTGDKPLSCKWCEEKFSYASTLRSHRLRCHPDKAAPSQQPVAPHEPHAPREPRDPRDPHDPHDPHDPRDPHHSLNPYALSQVHAAVRAAIHQDYIKEDLTAKNEVEYAINKSQ